MSARANVRGTTSANSATASSEPSSARAHQPSYVVAAIVAIAVLLLYLFTLSPTAAMWDTGEYMAAAKDLGLPHPPGNPLFMLLGHTFGLLPLPGSYAVRVNLLAALSSATAAGFWFLITERILATWLSHRWERLTGGVIAVLISATAFTVWNQSVVNEKVYTVSLAFFAVVSWLMVRWADDPDDLSADRVLVLVAYLIGLGYANHPAGLLTAPATAVVVAARRPWKFIQLDVLGVGAFVLYALLSVIGLVAIEIVFGSLALIGVAIVAAIGWGRAKSRRGLPLVLLVAGALGLGLTPFAYEPIRAAHFPRMNEGETTACTTHIGIKCTFSDVTLQRLRDNINRQQYGQKLERGAPYSVQTAMWWLYFKWQWLRDPRGAHPFLQFSLAMVFLTLGLVGGLVHWRRDRQSFWFFGPLVFTMTLALIYFLNFKYGWSQSPELGDTVQREVRDRDYFYIWSFSAWGVWAGIGLVFVWQEVARLLEHGDQSLPMHASPSRRALFATSPILGIALVPLIANWNAASHRGQTFTRDWASDVLNSVPPYTLLITNGDNDTFPLWYAQEVEGIRPDVTVVVSTYLNIDWAARQMIRRTTPTYDVQSGPALYRGKTWPKPAGSPLNMTFAEADSIPDYVQLTEPQVFKHGDIIATIKPGYLTRDQIVALNLIKAKVPERPIYFSTAHSLPTDLGLDRYMLSEGLVQKLMDHPIVPSGDTLMIRGMYLDLPGTYERWKMFKGPKSLIAQGSWVDRASLSIPIAYVSVGLLLEQGLAQANDTTAVQRINGTVTALLRAANIH